MAGNTPIGEHHDPTSLAIVRALVSSAFLFICLFAIGAWFALGLPHGTFRWAFLRIGSSLLFAGCVLRIVIQVRRMDARAGRSQRKTPTS